ncbi:MAG: M48 family metallopeptidase [Candidatus Nitrosocaldus sp.]|nr:M48 family metallopeptidase [Candidatus Nitrosocaldus sp.]
MQMEMDVDMKVLRSRRRKRSIELQFTDDGVLLIRVPYSTDYATIYKVVSRHERWIRKTLSRMKRERRVSRLDDGRFLYLGNSYGLKVMDLHVNEPLILVNGCFYISRAYMHDTRALFIKWYTDRAYEKVSERVIFYAGKYNFRYNRVRITNARRRWGSCSSSNNLNFSWRLIMAPLEVIDYVVVHELVHTRIRNHSKAFWRMVEAVMPDYDRQRRWLRENGHMLNI